MDSYNETVFDFDLNFLQQKSKDSVTKNGIDKQRKAIVVAKKKIIATNTLIEKFYAKKEQFEAVERSLLLSKEECKKVCIDYRNVMEKCARLEHEAQILQSANRSLQERIEQAENSQGGIQSHVKQLQVLIKDYETKFESHAVNVQLEKKKAKENEKKRLCMRKENEELVKNLSMLSSTVLGKKKISKKLRLVLKKYAKSTDPELSDQDGNSDDDIFQEPTSPNDIVKKPDSLNDLAAEDILIRKNEDQDSDGANEIVSEDTGRGSSLAFSDSDKCFNSPDYYVDDSPPSILKIKGTQQGGFTSPRYTTVDRASSPIFKDVTANALEISHEGVDQATSPIRIFDKNPGGLTSPLKKCLSTEKATSPRSLFKPKLKELTSSLIETARIAISPTLTEDSYKNDYITSKKAEYPISGISPLLTSNESKLVKQGYQFVDTSSLSEDIVSDREIEMILSEMRFSHNFITPLPATPSRSADTTNAVVQHECLDAKKAIEENKKIHENVANLTKEILSIKNMLMQQQLLGKNTVIPSGSKDEVNNSSPLFMAQNENVVKDLKKIPVPNTIPTIQIISPLMSPAQNIEVPDHGVDTEEDIEFDISDSENSNNFSHQQRFEFEDPEYPSDNTFESNNVVDIHSSAKAPPRKLTRLEKLRKKMLPKSKIKQTATISKKIKERRLKFMSKKLEPHVVKKVTEKDTAASLNDKTVYEKALKVMKELKSKSCSNINATRLIPRRKLRNQTKGAEKCIDHNKIEETTPCSIIKTRSQSKIVLQTNMNTSPVASNKGVTPQSKENSPIQHYLSVAPDLSKKNNVDNNISHNVVLDKRCSKRISITLTDVLDKVVNEEAISLVNANPYNKINKFVVSESKRRTKRPSVELPDFSAKRRLRSLTVSECELSMNVDVNTTDNGEEKKDIAENTMDVATDSIVNTISTNECPVVEKLQDTDNGRNTVDYSDLFTENTIDHNDKLTENDKPLLNRQRKNRIRRNVTETSDKNILCAMIEKHGIITLRHARKNIPEATVDSTCKKIEETISKIIELPSSKTNDAMNKFVEEVKAMNWKHFILGLIQYLKDPERKNELYKKVNSPPAPPMTKYEQILLYVVIQIQASNPSLSAVDSVLKNIEYTLFALNRTPDFDSIESMSHFYAIICRYFKAKSRLRLFVIDAMYCIQFKSVTLIKQCLDVWMHVLPLAHMGIAKSPLVTCLIYLLHFYKCEDKFNKVQDIRNILNRKYFYEMSEWNETKILEFFTAAIIELRDITIERKMLRLALIILAKRNGARWCQNNVIKKILQHLIAKEDVPDRIKVFCVSMLGPLLKPYPAYMKVHCEIVLNQLIEMLQHNPSDRMTEAIFSSLICVSKHNPNSVLKAFFSWNPQTISVELEAQIRDFVREKNIKSWKFTLSKMAMEERNKELYSE